ncbi:MAG: hypothetical protein PVH29_06135 [Candidatus Zixiibacteriota bacterium]|jgi:hypothetical protein
MSTPRILTTNYATYQRLGLAGGVAVSVTVPPWFKGPTCPALVPPPDLVKEYRGREVTAVEYEALYLAKRLNLLDPGRVAEELVELAAPYEPILLCWCGRRKFCHRRVIREWFDRAGIRCEEVNVDARG